MDAQELPDPSPAPAQRPAAPAHSASWNPALRREKEEIPAASTKPQSKPEFELSSEDEEEDEDEDEEDDEEEEKDNRMHTTAPQPLHVNGTEEASQNATQALKSPLQLAELHNSEPISGQLDRENEEESSVMSHHQQTENYEHQGETTALEDAVAESVELPLVDDIGATTDDWGESDVNFDLGAQAKDAPLQTPHAEAAGTTVGDDVIGSTTIGGNAGEDIDWGNVNEPDDFFSGTADQTAKAAEPEADAGAKSAPQSTWDVNLDLDDDFLPEKEEAPVFHLSDDEGFLEDEPGVPVQSTRSGSNSASRYAPQTSSTTTATSPLTSGTGPYAPHTTSSQNLQQTPNVGPAYNGFGQNLAYQQQNTRPAISSAQSFADKSKGGYASPYDMPDDIVTTRRRPAPRTAASAPHQPPPPPRTSSMSSSTGAPRPLPPSNASTASMSPPSSGYSMQAHMTGQPPAVPSKAAPSARSSSSDFFAELPVTSKPRPSGRYTPQPNVPSQVPPQQAPPQLPPKERTASWSSLRNEVLPDGSTAPPLRQHHEPLPMFPSQPSVPARANSLDVLQHAPPSNRYSPAPPPSGPASGARYSPAPPSGPGASARYSPAPGSNGQVHSRGASEPPNPLHRTPSQPHAPRTSSPLAFHSTPQPHEPSPLAHEPHAQQLVGHHASQSADGVPRPPYRSTLGGLSETEEPPATLSSRPPTGRSETPPLRSTPSSTVGSPRKKANYTPHVLPSNVVPPPRSHSQSPSASLRQSVSNLSNSEQYGSPYGIASLPPTYGVQPTTSSSVNRIPHRRQASLNYEAIVPEDERAADPLQRWKGHPVFTWGMGGTVVTSFPKQIPRYGAGMSAPVMKCSPGEIKVHNVKEMFSLPEDFAKFPGPLKGKSKKKDVSTWLGRKIEALEMQLKEPGVEHTLSQEDLRRLEDRVLLWKLMQILLEHNGQLEGTPGEAAVKKLLSPDDGMEADAEGSFSTAADIVGRSRSNTSTVQAEPVDAQAVKDLQKMLARGDREKAVWHAVDQRLWGHAMLLSSTLSKDIWKQVVQEFVRKEVKKVGQNNEALAVLYEVFAGNHVDCVDELVPASARAGFQMVSADGAGAPQNALQGLEKWRETVALILNNRSDGDASALLSLGRLLAQYGRVEAAHVCFVFARAVVNISGVDDAQADLVLLGADHSRYPTELGVDLDTVLLTEVFEFAISLSGQPGSHIIPHLQSFKLVHAYRLAEYGYRADAQAYCDAIAASMKATTRISPYYNASFIACLDDLSKRLSQSPKDGTSSWISKPSMDKVGSSLLSKFNSFIAGDEEGTTSNPMGGGEASPFAKIAGDSPSITPSQSSADLYGAYPTYAPPTQPPAPSNSRYAPSNMYTPRASIDQQQSPYAPHGHPSIDSTGRAPSVSGMSDAYMPMTPSAVPYSPPQSQLSPTRQRTQGKAHSYSPLRPEHNVTQSFGSDMPIHPSEGSASTPSFDNHQFAQASFDDPPTNNGTSTNAYGPPSSTSSYQPYNPSNEEDEQKENSPQKKKSFMDDDDDDDLITRAAALKNSGKSEADKKADEAFRKAAEADAQHEKDAAAGKKGGWLSGWFKKDPNAGPGPVKAKLGEENSFVYDPDLKKWVNKKGGATEASRPAATPPPPRAGPPGARSVSTSGASPPMGPPSGPLKPPTSMPRSSSMPPPMAIPGSRASTPGIPSDTEGAGPRPPVLAPPSLGAASGPPSRPGTSMSNASSIDDLLGAPQARKGAGAKKKKGGRYVDVMAQGN